MNHATESTKGGSKSAVLDFFLSSHLGDALCATPLPRQLHQERGGRVEVIKHRSTLSVFANNPFVAGFTVRWGRRRMPFSPGPISTGAQVAGNAWGKSVPGWNPGLTVRRMFKPSALVA